MSMIRELASQIMTVTVLMKYNEGDNDKDIVNVNDQGRNEVLGSPAAQQIMTMIREPASQIMLKISI